MIPISVVYARETMDMVDAGHRVPCHLYGYGSYGMCVESDFRSTRLPLLDRGMIYVIAHVRGGGEMGRHWYEEPNGGKYLCKKNTFDDFVDVARYLSERWTSPDMLSCEGRSAGGLLIGASINQAPELFRCAILGVPFVDVVCTMTDSTIPLTSGEWVEWGNPNEEKYFRYMMEYSPMNNVQGGRRYPACWLTGGLHDPRVAYWEPAKFTATLRHANPDNENPVCMKLDLSAGHFSASDRYKYYRELAYDYSFLLDQLNLAKVALK
jgi:oligopeptidase B